MIDIAKDILKKHHSVLEAKANVVGTGIGYKVIADKKTPDISLVCFVEKKVDVSILTDQDIIPKIIEGMPTDVVQSGVFKALRTGKHRPAPGGVSIGHYAITAGTLGCLAKKNNKLVILSNNHVLANSNDAGIGDAILQPGPHDGGTSEDKIATLEDFVPISFVDQPSPCSIGRAITSVLNFIARICLRKTRLEAIQTSTNNLVDAAIATPVTDDVVTNEILEIGIPQGTAQAELGMAIQKSGRTTGLTTGEVEYVDVTVNVQYGAGKIACFTDQIMAGTMCEGGDSGSIVLDNENHVVGLLFAGSDTSTIINRIEHVCSGLEIEI